MISEHYGYHNGQYFGLPHMYLVFFIAEQRNVINTPLGFTQVIYMKGSLYTKYLNDLDMFYNRIFVKNKQGSSHTI